MTESSSVLGTGRRTDRNGTEERMFSLMEVAQETGIAMPILLRYKREHPDTIPSAGSGAQQRFPEAAFAAFQEIHDQEMNKRDLPRRGGFGLLSLPRVKRSREHPDEDAPRPDAEEAEGTAAEATGDTATSESRPAYRRESWSKPQPQSDPAEPSRAAEPAAPSTGEATLTLKDISEAIGVAYPTVARYATKFPDRIPHEGEGRQRRFPPEAIEVFRQIRKESKPGRPPKNKAKKKARQRQAAAPAARRPAEAAAAPQAPAGPDPGVRPQGAPTGQSSQAGPGQAALGAEAPILDRIERLERNQRQLETMVRALREQIDKPLTVTVEPQ
ncbi:MAG: helix-turn-helix domain-containing protein [Acidobacteriota bacterium]|jgi:hypothetical protein